MLKNGTTVYTAFSEYTVDRQISQGGNGTVFQVHDMANEKFALKAIDRNKISTEKLKRFKNEIAFCENNNNSNVLKVLDHGTHTVDERNLVFYIMPLYDQTLRGLMVEGVEPGRVLPTIAQILAGLRFAHEKGVWHRDIKPENILIDGHGNAVIADFGIAHFSSDDLATIVETRRSDRMANFQYAAPEQRTNGGVVDGRADIYAVGMILNEMFTHTLPLGSNYKRIGDVNPEYAWLDGVVDSMLRQAPGDRPYPASTVATRILAAQKDWRQAQELLQLTEEQSDNDGPYQMEVPTIRDYLYDEGMLKVYLDGIDPYWFEVWFSILQQGNYNHSARTGYEPIRLRRYSPDCIGMPISISSSWDNNLKSVAQYLKEWIVSATSVFNADQRQRYEREATERRQKKAAEINRLREEARLRAAVKGLFE